MRAESSEVSGSAGSPGEPVPGYNSVTGGQPWGSDASVNVRGDKVTGTVGALGTGLSYRQTLVDGSEPVSSEPYRGKPGRGAPWMVLIATVLYLIIR